MVGNCCDTNIAPDAKNKKLQTLAAYMRQSVFCGIAGSAKFIIAFSSYVQAAAFLKLFNKNMDYTFAEKQHYVKLAALRGMKQGILPAIEMFVLMPVMFAGLHVYAGLPILACIAICWAVMFSVCLFARLTKIVSKCPTIEVPMYAHSSPFPAMEGSLGGLDDFAGKTLTHNTSTPTTPSGWKVYGAALLFVIPRCLTLIGSLVLLSVETLCLVPILLRDSFTAWKNARNANRCDGMRREKVSAAYDATKDQALMLCSLFVAVVVDALWIASLGLLGIQPIRTITGCEKNDGVPDAKLSDVLAPDSAKTPQDNQKGATAPCARAS